MLLAAQDNAEGLFKMPSSGRMPVFQPDPRERATRNRPASDGASSLKSLSISLLLRRQGLKTDPGHRDEPALVITVLLAEDIVQQEWVKVSELASAQVDPPDNDISSGPGGETKWEAVRYLLPLRTLHAFTDQHGIPRLTPDEASSIFTCPIFRKLSEVILPTFSTPRLFSSAFMDTFVMLFCSHVVQRWNNALKEQNANRGGLSPAQKRKITEFTAAHIEQNITLSMLAEQCSLSVSHFSRAFKKSFGLPAYRWITLHRVEHARRMLLMSEASLVDIGLESGFPDQASFNRTFAKLVGISPGRWRRSFKT
jgi:AraC family transcriptional regulator